MSGSWKRLGPDDVIVAGDEILDHPPETQLWEPRSPRSDSGDVWRPARGSIGMTVGSAAVRRRVVEEEPDRFRVAIGGTHSIARGR